jgi:hypothetical protein
VFDVPAVLQSRLRLPGQAAQFITISSANGEPAGCAVVLWQILASQPALQFAGKLGGVLGRKGKNLVARHISLKKKATDRSLGCCAGFFSKPNQECCNATIMAIIEFNSRLSTKRHNGSNRPAVSSARMLRRKKSPRRVAGGGA